MTAFLSVYLVPVFVTSFLLYMRRPKRHKNRMLHFYNNDWLQVALGFFLMLYVLTVVVALHIKVW